MHASVTFVDEHRALDAHVAAVKNHGLMVERVHSADGAIEYYERHRATGQPGPIIVLHLAPAAGANDNAVVHAEVQRNRPSCQQILDRVSGSKLVLLTDAGLDLEKAWPGVDHERVVTLGAGRPPDDLATFIDTWRSVWSAADDATRVEARRRLAALARKDLERRDAAEHDLTNALSLLYVYGGPEDIEAIDALPVRHRTGEVHSMALEIRRRLCEKYGVSDVASSVARAQRAQGQHPALWSGLASPTNLAERRDALRELLRSEAPGLAAFVIEQLAAIDPEIQPPASAWRDTLLFAAEHLTSLDGEERKQLADLLLRHAEGLRVTRPPEKKSDERLWAAVRHYALLVPNHPTEQDLHGFLAFLDDDDVKTRQVALQALANVFSGRPPSASIELKRIRSRVSEVARESLQRIERPEEGALAVSAYSAAAAIGVPDLDTLTEALIAAEGPLAWHALVDLGPLAKQWRSEAPGDPALEALGKATGRLRKVVEERTKGQKQRGG